MNLVTVTNDKFIASAINLIESYKQNSFNHSIVLCYFSLKEEYKTLLKSRYGSQITLEPVPEECDHAHNPRAFFYKAYALYKGASQLENFVYSDATNTFVNMTVDLLRDTSKHTRLFLPYPYDALTNKYWTTNECFKAMNTSPSAQDAPQYWAGFQSYISTDENVEFAKQIYESMKNPKIALPDTTVKRPDGPAADCNEHRQDQSVYSLLINENKWHQNYDYQLMNKYGDWQTMHVFSNGSYRRDIAGVVLDARSSKFGNYRFLPNNLLSELNEAGNV